MNIDRFERIWNVIGSLPILNSNSYRVFIELCINGEATQAELCKRNGWKDSSVSKTMKKLYEAGLVNCKESNRRLVYYVNEEKYFGDGYQNLDLQISMEMMQRIWNQVSKMNRMSANMYRVFLDVCIYGSTTQKDLWERRGWKIAGVSDSVRKLHELGLLECEEQGVRRVYTVNKDLTK